MRRTRMLVKINIVMIPHKRQSHTRYSQESQRIDVLHSQYPALVYRRENKIRKSEGSDSRRTEGFDGSCADDVR